MILRRLFPLILLSTFAIAQSGTSGGVRSTGTPAANDCVKFVSKNVITTTGSPCGSGSGTVTSVGFTGGLISVGTPTTTPAFTVAGTSGGIPYFSSASTWATSAALAAGGLVLGGGAGTTPATSTQLTFSAPTLTVGLAGTSSGILALSGSTSGAATITAPATAGTSTNAIAVSNVISGPAGNATNPTFGSANIGWYFPNSTTGSFTSNGTQIFRFNGSEIDYEGGGTIRWNANASDLNGANTTTIGQTASGVFGVGTSSNNGSGKVKAAGYMSVGTKFTTNAGCGESSGTTTGGATAGKFTTAGSTSCTTIITMGDSATAPNGWDCHVVDLTTAADFANPHISASNATTATIVSGTIVASDVISFSCLGY